MMESLGGMRILMPRWAAYVINLRALAPSRLGGFFLHSMSTWPAVHEAWLIQRLSCGAED